jgi:hypothetical protein
MVVRVRGSGCVAFRFFVLAFVALLGSIGFLGVAEAAPVVRGFELVSPVDKNGGEVVGDGQTTIAALSGRSVAFSARVGFADTQGSGQIGQTQYVARRGADGWLTKAVTPTPAPESLQIFLGSTSIPWFSDDLSRGVLGAYDLRGASDDVAQGANIYREDTTSGALQTVSVSRSDPIGRFDFANGPLWGVSADDSHVALVSTTQLLPEAAPGVSNAYDWSDGVLRLAGVLPDGSVPVDGSDIGPQNYRQTVSADGSRVVFISPPSGASQLYMRIGGARTVWITQSESTVPVLAPTDVNLQGVSADGRYVLFTTDSQLLDADTNSGPDLYLYTDSPNPATDSNLTLISDSGTIDNASSGSPVVGMSDDAGQVYFQDATSNTLFRWNEGILQPISGGVLRGNATSGGSLSTLDADPGLARVAVDGTRLAFLSDSTLGSDHVHALTGEVTNAHIEMYVYDALAAPADALRCVSCVQGGGVSTGASVTPAATQGTSSGSLPGVRPRFLSSDGRRVFFSTVDALVSSDTNGVSDVYEYDTASKAVSLVSTGRGVEGAWFADASSTGDDVFLVTRQRLVGWDRDGGVDLYDARVGGGFSEPAAPAVACVSDECQGPLGLVPGFPVVGSVSFDGNEALGGPLVGRVRLGRVGVVLGSVARLSVRVSGRGRLSWSGSGLRGGAKSFSRAGLYKVRLALSAHAGAVLSRTGAYRTRVTVVFVPSGGVRASVSVVLRFKGKSAKKGRGRS